MTSPPLVPCPGCGGRNPSDAATCDWCGRSFKSPNHQLDARWLRLGASLVFAALVATVVLLAVLNATRPAPARAPASTPTPAPSATPASRAPTLAPAASDRLREVATPAAPASVASPSPGSEPPRPARIANTGGQGAFLRREPSASAPSVTALREGAEVAVLQREELAADRLWRLVRDARGLEGWVLADFLEFVGE